MVKSTLKVTNNFKQNLEFFLPSISLQEDKTEKLFNLPTYKRDINIFFSFLI